MLLTFSVRNEDQLICLKFSGKYYLLSLFLLFDFFSFFVFLFLFCCGGGGGGVCFVFVFDGSGGGGERNIKVTPSTTRARRVDTNTSIHLLCHLIFSVS